MTKELDEEWWRHGKRLISKDNKENEENWYYFKSLMLISQERANILGVPAESPTFVSPLINGRFKCRECSTDFTPLVYQTGYAIMAQHFHNDMKSGIFFYRLLSHRAQDDSLTNLIISTNSSDRCHPRSKSESLWVAFVEPTFPIVEDIYNQFTTRQVKVLNIAAYCIGDNACSLTPIESGIVVPSFRGLRGNDLVPLCSSDKHLELSSQALYKFRISEGQVYFSPMNIAEI